MILASPPALAVTVPMALTVATVSLVDSHVRSFLVAVSGNTLAVNILPEPPKVNARVLLLMTTPVTGFTTRLETKTTQVSVKPPSSLRATIKASPLPTGFTEAPL